MTVLPDAAESVTVKFTFVEPLSPSVTLTSPIDRPGAPSSSVTVSVTDCVPSSVPLATLSISTVTERSASSIALSTPVTVAVPDVLPARTMICAGPVAALPV